MNSLNNKLDSLKKSSSEEWSQPDRYRTGLTDDAQRLEALIDSGDVKRVVDPIDGIADDLFEYSQPGSVSDDLARAAFKQDIFDQGSQYGEWVHFDWSQSVVRYPEQDDHFKLRTSRDRNLDTFAEKQAQYDKTIALFGLSVGSNILDQLAQSAVGNRYLMGDFDILSPSNLNRVRASMAQVGLPKIDIVARKISEIDPFIEQIHARQGYNADTEDLLRDTKPDVVIDEVDDLEVKARLRKYAMDTKTPLVMVADVDDKSILHVERHDIEKIKPFKGKVSEGDFEALLDGTLPAEDRKKIFVKTAGGLRHVSPRMVQSSMAIGKELGGLPQRGSTATAGATLVNVALRSIFLDRGMKTGMYVYSPQDVLKTQSPVSKREAVAIFRDFLKSNR